MVTDNKKTALKIGQANVQHAKITIDEIQRYLINNTMDIIAIQEPYIVSDSTSGRKIVPYNFPTHQACFIQTDEHFYTALIVANPAFDVLILPQWCSSHMTAVSIDTGQDSFLLASVYCPPSDDLSSYLELLERFITSNRNSKIVIMGDFNSKSFEWYSSITDVRGETLSEFITNNDLYILNEPGRPYTFSSYNGNSNIDLTITNGNAVKLVTEWDVKPDVFTSDHRLITFSISDGYSHKQTEKKTIFSLKNINIPKLRREFLERLKDIERRLTWEPNTRNIDRRVNELTSAVIGACEATLRKITIKSDRNRWWNDEVSKLRETTNKARQLMQRHKGSHLDNYFHSNYRAKLKDYKRGIRKAKEEYWEKFIITDMQKNPWGFAYKMAAKRVNIKHTQQAIMVQGAYTNDMNSTLQQLLDQLMPDDNLDDDTPEQTQIRSQVGNFSDDIQCSNDFTKAILADSVLRIKRGKAPGGDNIHGVIIAALYGDMEDFLYRLFSDCLRFSYFPDDWKTGKLITILKSSEKDPTDPGSYRPITLLSEFGKLFERIIIALIHSKQPEKQFFSEHQYGFRKTISTVHILEAVLSDINDKRFKYKMAIFADIIGAFNNLWWPSTLQAMGLKGMESSIIQLIKSYLTNRKIVYSAEVNSVGKVLTKGCPQGSILGPFLWNLAIDGLLRTAFPDQCCCRAYADDVAIIIKADSRKELEKLAEQCMNILASWADGNKLAVSSAKTKYMVFGGKLERHPTVKIKGTNVQRVREYKYLGVWLDECLSFVLHVNKTAEKCKRMFQGYRRLIRANWRIPYQQLLKVYDGAVIPMIGYGLEIWGHRLAHSRIVRKLTEVQGACLKPMLGAYRTTPCDTLVILARRPPLHLILSEKYAVKVLLKTGTAYHAGFDIHLNDYRYMKDCAARLRELTVQRWQLLWDNSDKGRHVHKMIPSIVHWLSDEIQMNPTLTTLLSGHGNFGIHLFRIGKAVNPFCLRCHVDDDTVHRVTICPLFAYARQEASAKGILLPLNNTEIPAFLASCGELADQFNKFQVVRP